MGEAINALVNSADDAGIKKNNKNEDNGGTTNFSANGPMIIALHNTKGNNDDTTNTNTSTNNKNNNTNNNNNNNNNNNKESKYKFRKELSSSNTNNIVEDVNFESER